MLTAAEIARGTRGALAFLSRDPAAPQAFDNTMDACLRSFRVMALSAPIYILYLLVSYADVEVTADVVDIVLVETLRYVVEWLLFPVLFYEVARRRGWLDRYPRYINALNWTNLPATVIALVATAAELVVPSTASMVIDIALRALFFYWFLVTTRMVLGTDWLVSFALLALNWLPSFFLSILVTRYVGVIGLAGT